MCFFALPALAGLGAAAGASTLATASAVIGAASSLATGIMGMQAGNANAKMLEGQADLRLQKGEFDARNAITRYERQHGQAVANAGMTGLSLSSFADVFADSVIESSLEVAAIRYGARNEANNLRFQAAGQEANATAAIIGGVFGAAGQLTGGLAKAQYYGGSGAGTGSVAVGNFTTTVNPAFRG